VNSSLSAFFAYPTNFYLVRLSMPFPQISALFLYRIPDFEGTFLMLIIYLFTAGPASELFSAKVFSVTILTLR
jgi:hypothetical protein